MIINVYFARPIIVGGLSVSEWSHTGQNQIQKQCTIEDKGPAGVLIRFQSGEMNHEITVPCSNINQITRTAQEKKK